MSGEELFLEEENIPEEVVEQEEFPPEEAIAETPPEGAVAGSTMEHTLQEIPELDGRQVGDILPFTVVDVSDDGNTFQLEATPTPVETAGEAVGQEDLTDRLTT